MGLRLRTSAIRASAVVFAASAMLLLGTSAASAATLGCAEDASGVTDLTTWVPEMLAATNEYRTSKGLPTVQLDATLSKASLWKARDLARRNYFDHTDPASGSAPARTPWERLAACGYTANAAKAENIAAGQQSGEAFVQAWIDSPPHRANLENAAMRYVGFGVSSSTSSTYGRYAVQMFSSLPGPVVAAPATPPAAPTITTLAFALDGPAKLVCPPLSEGSSVQYVMDSLVGDVTAVATAAGCLRVAPLPGIGDVTATVTYHAHHPGSGLSSAPVTLAISVDSGRELLGGGPVAIARASIASPTSTVSRRRCATRFAVNGWCYRLTTTGQLLAADGTALMGQSIRVTRRAASGRYADVGTTRTTARGTFSLVTSLRPTANAPATWLARNAASVRVAYAGNIRHGSTLRTLRTRR